MTKEPTRPAKRPRKLTIEQLRLAMGGVLERDDSLLDSKRPGNSTDIATWTE
jgi:hypothetical protein